jgi:hypothetical protein
LALKLVTSPQVSALSSLVRSPRSLCRFAFRFFDLFAEIDLPQQRAYQLLRALDESRKNASTACCWRSEAASRLVLLAISIFVDRAGSVSVSE